MCPDNGKASVRLRRSSIKGAFWVATYKGALNGELFVELLKKLMYRRKKSLQFAEIRNNPKPVRSFFKPPSVVYIPDL